MEKLILNTTIRAADEKLKTIRAEKQFPAVVYGAHQEPISIKIDNSEFIKTFRKSGESNIIELMVGKKKIDVLVHDIQFHPVIGNPLHVDFYAITAGEKVSTKIHLEFTGQSPAVKLGGILQEQIKEVEVKCLPKDLVDNFGVDLSVLKEFGDNIHVSDLGIDPEKYELTQGLEDVVATVSKPKVEEEETETTEAVADAPAEAETPAA